MLDGYSDYLQQTLDVSYQSPPIEVNLRDVLEDHLFSGLHHAILLDLLFLRTKITFGDISLLESSVEPS
jgi:hypothetical protein